LIFPAAQRLRAKQKFYFNGQISRLDSVVRASHTHDEKLVNEKGATASIAVAPVFWLVPRDSISRPTD
jgi:hypothetical protein